MGESAAPGGLPADGQTSLDDHIDASRELGLGGRLLSVAEAAHLLGVSASMVRKLIGQERIEAVRIGRRVLAPPSEVQRIMRGG